MIKKKKNKLINEEDERERCFISNTTMHLVSTDRVRNNLHVSLLFIQGYIDREQSCNSSSSVFLRVS